ncbi:MAG: hypothetical protein WAR41_05855 [Azonexus sp.]|jgi:hypothetical protein
MSPTKILARIFDFPNQSAAESVGYDEVFKGTATVPCETVMAANWLPGLRPVECESDSYFKDVFAGKVF